MGRLTAVIFDMDGLMVDTEPLSRQAWQQVIANYDHTLDDAMYRRIIGRRFDESARMVLDAYPMPLTPAELFARKDAIFAAIRAQGVPAMPGLDVLLDSVAARGLFWGVATSSPQAHAREVLTQLKVADQCRAIAGGDEVQHGKPAPDIYLLAAARLGVDPASCLALEDSPPGCEAAAAAGMTTVAVPNGVTQTAAFPCARHIYASLHQVAADLDRLLAG